MPGCAVARLAGFALAGPKYFQAFRSVVRTRIAEGLATLGFAKGNVASSLEQSRQVAYWLFRLDQLLNLLVRDA